ncbi:MAG: hypothetical protein HY819_07230 [Acidobacteria bacterium]|nr:hypothetical protein [Acidobacteriota bacterium]
MNKENKAQELLGSLEITYQQNRFDQHLIKKGTNGLEPAFDKEKEQMGYNWFLIKKWSNLVITYSLIKKGKVFAFSYF